jgi:catechol 2,3-dioxygenase-like lactoylglutathione lyase family enzyme
MTEKVAARLNVVTFGVRDLLAVRSFYEALGWESRSAGDEFVRFEIGGAVLALYPLDALAEEADMPPPADTERFAGFTCAIVVQSEEMVDAAIDKVREAGGRILAEPVARARGGRSGYFADPEGNTWEIAWLLGSTFDARGCLIWPRVTCCLSRLGGSR